MGRWKGEGGNPGLIGDRKRRKKKKKEEELGGGGGGGGRGGGCPNDRCDKGEMEKYFFFALCAFNDESKKVLPQNKLSTENS